MQGHSEIIQMRRAGRVPGIVFINDWPCSTRWAEWGEYATVCTHRDPLSSLDLRFLVGMTVSISADSEKRAKGLFRLAKDAGAKTVAACHVQRDKPIAQANGWAEIHHG